MNNYIFPTKNETYIPVLVIAFMLCMSALSHAAIDKITSSTPITLLSPTTSVPVKALLDVGIVAFDDGLDLTDEDDTVFPEVRLAESVYFATQLLRVLEKSGAWGPARVIPDRDAIMDLYIEGTILQSDGETLAMDIVAVSYTHLTLPTSRGV